MLTLAEMFTPLTKDQVLTSLLGVASALGLPIEAWQPGSVPREILEVVAQKLADFTQVTSAIASGGLLDYATGGWLTLLARSVYGLERILATFGTTTESMINASGVTYVIAAGDLHFLNNVTGKTYTNTTGGTLLSGGGTLDLDIIADESGTDSNATAGAIDSLVTPLLGVTMTNDSALTASDEETDTQLRDRCRSSLAAASPNGAADAYDFFAKSAVREDGSAVGVTRTRVSQSAGAVTVYVANDSGAVTGTAIDPTTDLGAVNELIQLKCVPTGITATIATAVEAPTLVTGDVYLRHGSTLTVTEIRELVLGRLQDYWKTIPIGGFDIGAGGNVFLDAIIGQIFQASSDAIQATISAPGADVSLSNFEVSTLTSVAGSFTIHST